MTSPLSISIAIVAGAALVAVTILFLLRWEIVSSSQGLHRLDRWSGRILTCLPTEREPLEPRCGDDWVAYSRK